MKLGLTSYAYPWAIGVPGYPLPATPMNADGLLRRAAELGLRAVQLCDNLTLLSLDAPSRQDIVGHANRLGIEIEVGGRGLTAENLDAHIELCHDFGAKLLRFVIDGPGGYEPALSEIASLLRPRIAALEKTGITLAIENHDRFRAAELAAFIRELGHPHVGICLDTANSLAAGEGFATVFSHLADLTVNLHVKDVRVCRLPHQLGFTISGCVPGTGVIAPDLPAMLASLAAGGRCRSVLLESWPEPSTDIEETCTREHAWAVQGAAWLQSILPS